MRFMLFMMALLITSNLLFAQQRDNKTGRKQESAKSEQHLKLYPIEATTYVNMYVEFQTPTDFTVTIVGSPLNDERTWKLRAKSSYQQSIDVTQLPAGVYTILLKGGGIEEKAEFRVKK